MKNRQKTTPKVSIIIPVYNGSNYLKEAIDSALAQTYSNIEVIVVNDGSDDNGATEKIAKSYGVRIRYYKKENGGVAAALNYGIEKMTGEYFSWLSHDDLYARRKIELQIIQLMKEKSRKTIISCNTKILFPGGIKKKTKIDEHAFKYLDIFLSSSAMVGLNGCSLLIPKDAFTTVGLFNESLLYTQDYDLWFRMQKQYRFVLLDKHLVISRAHPEQGSVLNIDHMIDAGDQLHSNFINSIPYRRFDEYFKDNKQNIKHTYKNYKVYRDRCYKKTATLLLKTILRFNNENNKNEFYRIYYVELISNGANKPVRNSRLKSHYYQIDQEYREQFNVKDGLLPIIFQQSRGTAKVSKTSRLINSLMRDGLYLSGEKTVRKLHSKLSKNKP